MHPTPSQILGHQVSDQHLPDVNLIGEFSDPAELGKLLQLVLSCAISCEKKQGVVGTSGEDLRRGSPMYRILEKEPGVCGFGGLVL